MVVIIALAFATVILFGVIYSLIKSSGESNEIEEKFKSYTEEDPDREEKLRRLAFYEEYVNKLDSWRNQNIITQEDYEAERAMVSDRLDEIEREEK